MVSIMKYLFMFTFYLFYKVNFIMIFEQSASENTIHTRPFPRKSRRKQKGVGLVSYNLNLLGTPPLNFEEKR